MLTSLEGNLSGDAILEFATIVVGKVDVALLTYAPIGQALECLESRLCSGPPTPIGTDNGTSSGAGNGTVFPAEAMVADQTNTNLHTDQAAGLGAETELVDARLKGHTTVVAKDNEVFAALDDTGKHASEANQHAVAMARAMLEHSGRFVLQYGPDR